MFKIGLCLCSNWLIEDAHITELKNIFRINKSYCFKQFNDVWRRGPQSPGEERREDGGKLPFSDLFVFGFLGFFFNASNYFLFFFYVFLLFRSGLCGLLRRLGSNSVAPCWSDSQPTRHSIVLPVGYCHEGGEA